MSKRETQRLRNRLIKRLESGTVKQAKGRLRRGDAMCCLGVACDVFDPSKWNGATYLGADAALPREVQDAYGFLTALGAGGKNMKNLAAWNDDGLSFPKIAARLRTGKYWRPL